MRKTYSRTKRTNWKSELELTEKSVREQLREQAKLMELDEEYGRIMENEMIYLDEITTWRRLEKATTFIPIILFFPAIVALLLLPEKTQMNFETIQQYPLNYSLLLFYLAMFIFSPISKYMLSNKISKIKDELALHKEESLYLSAYETYSNVESYLKEDKPKRKIYFKRIALRSAKELVDVVGGWEYGNVRLVSNLVGQQIDLFKDNMKRLVLSNVAKGDKSNLQKLSEILIEFCKYLMSPSIEKLERLNEGIEDLPFREYKFETKRERLSGYLQTKPRFFRLLFAGSVTAIVMVILWCLNQSLGLIIAVAVPCFWGAFSGFDKLFGLKE